MASAIPVPEQPGRLFIPATGSVVQQDSQYEGAFFDTVEFTAFTAGAKRDVFKDQTGSGSNAKELHHTNLTQSKRIPSHTKLKLYRLGVFVRQMATSAATNPSDSLAIYDVGNIRFLLGSTNLIAEGPLLTFPSGYGVTGSGGIAASAAAVPASLTLGVPSTAAAPQLMEKHDINDKMDLNCQIRVDAQDWTAAAAALPTMVGSHVLVTVFLSGIITRPLGA